ncbi:transcriptional regulator, LuxR family [Methylobacterium sp. 4-46]|uniref:helix-turn-helix transcriptional regulator n=1 Tax=unclassified Methylobacterium TaxID=2615210 RepID=UPI000165C7E3|nr:MULTISPECIES: helix-turn-helix transcriptional regulator [Methylobacterium]ACA16874.1 transcriptional regulator, LuxR family [Methylobacterium sp. 4-46]WFT82565.1 helix-turn-helix transcriptional regulator [Methylobacterium nodulans]
MDDRDARDGERQGTGDLWGPDLLDRMGIGALLLAASGDAVEINRTAAGLLRGAGADEAGDAVLARIRHAARDDPHGRIECEAPPGAPARWLAFRSLPIGPEPAPRRLVILVDPKASTPVREIVLEKVFQLTAAEARLAAQLSTGMPLARIAKARGVSITTLRTQLAAIFEKTGTSRQAELVVLLARTSLIA